MGIEQASGKLEWFGVVLDDEISFFHFVYEYLGGWVR